MTSQSVSFPNRMCEVDSALLKMLSEHRFATLSRSPPHRGAADVDASSPRVSRTDPLGRTWFYKNLAGSAASSQRGGFRSTQRNVPSRCLSPARCDLRCQSEDRVSSAADLVDVIIAFQSRPGIDALTTKLNWCSFPFGYKPQLKGNSWILKNTFSL